MKLYLDFYGVNASFVSFQRIYFLYQTDLIFFRIIASYKSVNSFHNIATIRNI